MFQINAKGKEQQTFAGLQDVMKDEILLHWRRLQDVFKTSWRQTKCLLGISLSNESKYVSKKSVFNKSVSDESKVNQKCIN